MRAGVLNGTIVVAGSRRTNRTDIYDIASGIWHSGPPMPAQRASMASAVSHGGLWLVGGTINGSLGYDTWVTSPRRRIGPKDGRVGSMLTGRMILGAAVVDDVIYAMAALPPGSGEVLSFRQMNRSARRHSRTWPRTRAAAVAGNPLAVQWQSTNPSAPT